MNNVNQQPTYLQVDINGSVKIIINLPSSLGHQIRNSIELRDAQLTIRRDLTKERINRLPNPLHRRRTHLPEITVIEHRLSKSNKLSPSYVNERTRRSSTVTCSRIAEILFSISFLQLFLASRKMAVRRRQQRKLIGNAAFSDGKSATMDSRSSLWLKLALEESLESDDFLPFPE
ncbi:unnamed protein product [Camellia sinensis]